MMYRVLFFFVVVVVVFVTFDFEDFKVPSITVNSPFDGSISGDGRGGGRGTRGWAYIREEKHFNLQSVKLIHYLFPDFVTTSSHKW